MRRIVRCLALVVVFHSTAAAEEEFPALAERALRRASLVDDGAEARLVRSLLVPRLTISGALAWPEDGAPGWRLSGWLGWPLPDEVVVAEARSAMQQARRREGLLDQLRDLWRARARLALAVPESDPLSRGLHELRREELDAEIEALAGPPGDEP